MILAKTNQIYPLKIILTIIMGRLSRFRIKTRRARKIPAFFRLIIRRLLLKGFLPFDRGKNQKSSGHQKDSPSGSLRGEGGGNSRYPSLYKFSQLRIKVRNTNRSPYNETIRITRVAFLVFVHSMSSRYEGYPFY